MTPVMKTFMASCLLVLAVACASVAHADVENLEFYVHFTGKRAVVFGPEPIENAPKFAQGTVFNFVSTFASSEKSMLIGTMSGLYFRESVNAEDQDNAIEVFTIRFTTEEIKPASSVSIVGPWSFNTNVHELPIVGGTGKFAYSYGQAVFEKVRGLTYKVKLTIVIEVPSSLAA